MPFQELLSIGELTFPIMLIRKLFQVRFLRLFPLSKVIPLI